MKYLILVALALGGCASQPQYATHTYIHSNGKVEQFTYRVPSTPGYVSNSSTTVYTDGRGAVIGYGITNGAPRQ